MSPRRGWPPGRLRHWLLWLVVVTTLVACATSPLGRRQLTLFPDDQLAQMGVQAFAQMEQQVPRDEDPAISGYVRCVSDAITEVLEPNGQEWEVAVFSDDSANAFALPGGKVGVHRGLLDVAQTPDQLATVIGHEIAHVLARHGNERVSQQFATEQGLVLISILTDGSRSPATQQTLMGLLGLGAQVGILLPFSRTQESEADLLGLDLMARAGFDPRASVELWENMARAARNGPPEFLSTHPSHETRISDLQGRMDRAMEIYEQARAEGRRPECRPPAS